MPFANSSYHVETIQLIYNVNRLAGFYMEGVFSLECISDQTIVLLLLKIEFNQGRHHWGAGRAPVPPQKFCSCNEVRYFQVKCIL